MSSSLLSAAGEGISGIFLPQHPLQGLRLMLLAQLAWPLAMCDYCQMMLNVGHWCLGSGICVGLLRVDEVPGCSSILAQKKVGFSYPSSEKGMLLKGEVRCPLPPQCSSQRALGAAQMFLMVRQGGALGWNPTERVGTKIARRGVAKGSM